MQGEGSKSELLERFRRLGNAVLVASQSFWEGVDVRGEALSLVVIDKLPFAPPDDPVLSARIEHMKRPGRNAFMEYQLPRAVINVKQGAGRLIRDETDRGVLMICDPRLIAKPYGKRVWRSLPPMRRTRDEAEVLAFFTVPRESARTCKRRLNRRYAYLNCSRELAEAQCRLPLRRSTATGARCQRAGAAAPTAPTSTRWSSRRAAAPVLRFDGVRRPGLHVSAWPAGGRGRARGGAAGLAGARAGLGAAERRATPTAAGFSSATTSTSARWPAADRDQHQRRRRAAQCRCWRAPSSPAATRWPPCCPASIRRRPEQDCSSTCSAPSGAPSGGARALRRIAIVDEARRTQYLYPEFLLFRAVRAHGIARR
jgi:hypothetical protein